MSDERDRLAERYASWLAVHVQSAGERPLSHAYEIGRQALASGFGILDVATLHVEAMRRLAIRDPEAAQAFLVEALSPFEIVHRGVQESNAALRRINEALENEARRIAHALHDDVGPLLVAVHMALHGIDRETPEVLSRRVGEVREKLDHLEDQLRQLSHELRPTVLEEVGLEAALNALASGVAIRAGVPITITCPSADGLSVTAQTALYRIVQQALINVGKHARATRASVRVTKEPRRIRCSIADDGVGFDAHGAGAVPAASGGLGLVGMRERATALGGTFEVSSAPGGGTVVQVTIPVEA
ncbi:MAG TPA: sensor histidine kinase [Candidatus Bathyarchaeia archaeon]|jgi:signal transduction histidine kinase|nr:sensor histidine kinase [Candidatus Bathyarchaeia archaeon]